MTPPPPPIPSRSANAPRALLRVVARLLAAALLIVGGTLTIGALWLQWSHFVQYNGTPFPDPIDTDVFVPAERGWGHSFLIFTVGALIAGVLAWLIATTPRGQSASVLALGSVLCACAGIVFASFNVVNFLGPAREVADIGYYVCLIGYLAIIAAGGLMLASSRRTAQS